MKREALEIDLVLRHMSLGYHQVENRFAVRGFLGCLQL